MASQKVKHIEIRSMLGSKIWIEHRNYINSHNVQLHINGRECISKKLWKELEKECIINQVRAGINKNYGKT